MLASFIIPKLAPPLRVSLALFISCGTAACLQYCRHYILNYLGYILCRRKDDMCFFPGGFLIANSLENLMVNETTI